MPASTSSQTLLWLKALTLTLQLKSNVLKPSALIPSTLLYQNVLHCIDMCNVQCIVLICSMCIEVFECGGGQMMLGPGADSYKTCLPRHHQQHDDPHEHQDEHVPDQQEHLLDHH